MVSYKSLDGVETFATQAYNYLWICYLYLKVGIENMSYSQQ